MKVYVVEGRTGLYPEDSCQWIVKAFSSSEIAYQFAINATLASTKILEKVHGKYYNSFETNPFDPLMQMIDGQAFYTVKIVDLD